MGSNAQESMPMVDSWTQTGRQVTQEKKKSEAATLPGPSGHARTGGPSDGLQTTADGCCGQWAVGSGQ